jgi:hypothetical protein
MNVVASPRPSSTAFQRSDDQIAHEKPILRSIKPERLEHQQRTLSTLVLAGTFMAGVEGQILSIILSLQTDTALRTGGLCFAILGEVTTSFAALYSAVTYIWLRGSWTPGPKHFHEWVAGCVGMMVRWCSSFLVVGTVQSHSVYLLKPQLTMRCPGTYSGFVALILFFFESSTLGVAIFATTIVCKYFLSFIEITRR